MEPYVPNRETWIKYYEQLGISEHPSFYNPERRLKGQTGGNMGQFGVKNISAIEKPHPQDNKTPELKVELVSPVEQIVQQAASEIKREKANKRKRTSCHHHSSKSKARRNQLSESYDKPQI